MRYLMLILLALAGCTQHLGEDNSPIGIWHSKDSSTDQKIQAVTNLVALGSTGTEVEKVLGHDGRWIHYHGPAEYVNVENGKLVGQKLPDADYWVLAYPVRGGEISLTFEKPYENGTLDDFKFVGHVGLQQKLKGTPFTPPNPASTN
jgi:hypothetical protein